MCNQLHLDSKPIPKSGYGYKLFELKDNRFYPLTDWTSYFSYQRKNIYNKGAKETSSKGFCFFLTKKEAEKAQKQWWPNISVLKRIKYNKGLGHHIDLAFTGKKLDIAICKEFSFIREKRTGKK